MRLSIQSTFLIALTFSAGGCKNNDTFRAFNQPLVAMEGSLIDDFSDTKFRSDYEKNMKDGDFVAAKRERNRILNRLIQIGRLIHERKDDYFHYGRATTDIALDAAQLATSAAAIVVPTESSKSILAAISTGFGGFQESVDLRLFFQQTAPALLASMHTHRYEMRTVLVNNMSKSVDDYPLEAGISDGIAFILAGGITDAIRLLAADAMRGEIEALAELRAALKVPGSDDSVASLKATQASIANRKTKIAQLDADIKKIPPPSNVEELKIKLKKQKEELEAETIREIEIKKNLKQALESGDGGGDG